MISLSTAYNIYKCNSWAELLKKINKLGFSAVELSVEVPESWFKDIEGSLSKGEVTISSLHNYCPRLETLPDGESIFSAYNLASPDEDERQQAVKYTCRTIEWAGRLGAKAIVVHAGEIYSSPSGRELFMYAVQFGRYGKLFGRHKSGIVEARKKQAGPYLENTTKSLDGVLNTAEKNKVKVGIETRIYHHEIPTIEETRMLLDKFSGSPLAYWHDTGHAEVNVRLGLVDKHEDYLDAFSKDMIGVHLHDLSKFSDHRAPGTGDFDFKVLKPYFNDDLIKVVEAHGKSSEKEVKKSIDYLKQQGLIK